MPDVSIVRDKRNGSLWAELPGGQLREVTPDQAQMIQSDPGGAGNILGSAADTAESMLTTAGSWLPDVDTGRPQAPDPQLAIDEIGQRMDARSMVSPASTMLGMATPGLIAGAATGGMGLAPLAATEAAIGATMSPDNPLLGAAIGAGAAAIPVGGVIAARSAAPAARRAVDRVMGRVAQTEQRMAAEGAEALAEGRRLEGLMTGEQAAAQGLPLTEGDSLALSAADDAMGTRARAIRRGEELRSTDPLFGAGIRQVREEQQGFLTQRVKQELGLDGPETLTPPVVGRLLQEQGAEFDELAGMIDEAAPPVAMVKDGGLPGAQDVIDQATGAGPAITKLLENYDNGVMHYAPDKPNPLTVLRSQLSKMTRSGAGQGDAGKVYDANEMLRIVDAEIEKRLPKEAQGRYKNLRQRYSITKKLMRPGVTNAEGMVNAASFRNSLLGSRNAAFKASGEQGSLLQAANTLTYLQQKVVPSSGTAERLMANPGRTAVRAASGLGLAGGAGYGIDALFN